MKLFQCMQGWGKVICRPYSAASMKLSPLQEAALEEQCILVDDDDKVVGHASKHDCHRIGKDGSVLLHRAFSVFVFNSKNELLLQKRSPHKITFPNCFTNSCCSHPLHDIPGEREEKGSLGILRAAQRRLHHELGIPPEQAALKDLQYLTRIQYKANDVGVWGENEIDYIILLHKDVSLNPNYEEVNEVRYLAREQLDNFIKSDVVLTPWFRLITGYKLRDWWDNLHRIHNFRDHETIHKLN
ncbi:isopentenyl-diphosphate Delta-isomerase 1 [Anabrus simplex]|uniref:isopentenyl-diphosphate Delta-isomerase 1 n=1 Tax=Anabrus simplex TaxID=316456 RepID=UPI0035A2EAFF